MKFNVVIPARFASTRLAEKLLLKLNEKEIVLHVIDQARKSGAIRVIVATDHEKIADLVKNYECEVCLTSPNHQSGSERIAEVVEKYQFSDDEIIVNVQGDEPLMPPELIFQVAENLSKTQIGMATLAAKLENIDDLTNPNSVKVVCDKNNYALYFSRSGIPFDRDKKFTSIKQVKENYRRHIGIYAYRASFLRNYVKWEASPLEQIEMLEQLRVLWHGEKIHVGLVSKSPIPGIDTKEDFIRVQNWFLQNKS